MHTTKPESQFPYISLEDLGLGTHFFAEEPRDGQLLGRVMARKAMRYEVATRAGILDAEVSGKLSYMAQNESDLPVVGDWVSGVWDKPTPGNLGLILDVLPRKGVLARRKVERSETAQVMAAHVDTLFIVWSLDHVDGGKDLQELKTRWGGIQRFITLATAGDLKAVVIFSKADLLPPVTQTLLLERARQLWPDIPAFMTGGLDQISNDSEGTDSDAHQSIHQIADLVPLLPRASTSVLVGLSGAGKSTLANALRAQNPEAGISAIKTGGVRADDARGRHTTTHRELYSLPSGGLIIDSPGIREIGIWGNEDDVDESFSEITRLAADCKFSDCKHESEPGCVVRAAILFGAIQESTLIQYRKQLSEVRKAEARSIRAGKVDATDKQIYEAGDEKRRWMAIHKHMKNFSKENRSKNG